MSEALYMLVGLCAGAGITGTILTIWHFKTLEKLLKPVDAVNVDQSINQSAVRSKRLNEPVKTVKPDGVVDGEAVNINHAQPQRERDPEVLRAEVVKLRAQGLSMRDIARQLGCSHSLVLYYLRKMK